MATRLYPNTKDSCKLEALCRVPSGTYAKALDMFELDPGPSGLDEDTEAWDRLLVGDSNLATMMNFLINGWGRMKVDRSAFGNTTDGNEVVELLQAQKVITSSSDPWAKPWAILCLTEGLHWY